MEQRSQELHLGDKQAVARGVVRLETARRRAEPSRQLVLEGDDLGPEYEHLVLDEPAPVAAMRLVVILRNWCAAVGTRMELGLRVVGEHCPLNARKAGLVTVSGRA